jgi:DMSO/TMAO reductase YedYZ molybdopterin-dependent catalytic subunit
VIAVAAQLAGGELAAAAIPGARGPVLGLVQQLIHTTPGPAVDAGVATVETADKALLKAGVVAGSLAAGALASERPGRAVVLVATASTAAAASCEDVGVVPALMAGAAGVAAGATAARLLGTRPAPRRQALGAAVMVATVAATKILDRAALRRLDEKRRARPLPPAATPPAEPGLPIAGVSPLYTPVGSFYVTDVSARPPRVDPDGWRLGVRGMVDRELELTLEEIESLGLVELDATLVCVHNPVGGDRIGTARWLGVPLSRLLEHVGVGLGADQMLARSIDGFTAGVPVEHIRSGAPALLAIAMNGERLPLEHGFPARLIVPGLWGADANTKWLVELELTTWAAVQDYWDRRGWPRQPSRVQPGSRIDVPANRARVEPGTVTVAGVAWAPPAGVDGVEIQVDEQPWRAVELGVEVAPTMWRQWKWAWEATPGEHVLRVRAIGRRRTQPGGAEPPYPVGVRGYHEHRLAVVAGRRPRTRRALAFVDDARGRLELAARGLVAWRQRGFPPAPRFPAPVPRGPHAPAPAPSPEAAPSPRP